MRKLLAAISILIVLSSCASPTNQSASTPEKIVERNVLTNLPGENGPVLAVKIDDTEAAHPQVGLRLDPAMRVALFVNRRRMRRRRILRHV